MTKLDNILKNIKADDKPVDDIDSKIDKLPEPKTFEKQDFRNGSFKTEDAKKNIREIFAKGKPRKERKRLLDGEHDRLIDKQKSLITLFAICLFAIFMLYMYNPGDEAIMSIVLIVGAFLFLPLGAVFGWLFLDPIMRCKILRKMTRGRKNYGIVMFVGKANKIVMKIKNFDEDLIWIGTKCWVLAKGKIKEISEDGNTINEGKEIDPEKIVSLSETIPVMFIDLTSMEPLSFISEGRERVSPEEIGSFIKSWIDNQMAKIMFLKKTLDIYFVIVIISALAGAYFGYQNSQEIEALKAEIETLKSMIGGIT